MSTSLKVVICLLIVATGYSAVSIHQKQNNPPEIRIVLSASQRTIKWNTLVPYTITVSDVEDGKSEYNEIVANEVLLEVRFVTDSIQARKIASQKEAISLKVPLKMGKALCFNCHGVRTKVIGPTFEQIAGKYKNIPHAVDTLSSRVIRGSTGIWSDVKMPGHPDHSTDEVRELVRWILKNGDDPSVNYFAGLEGAFRTSERPAGTTRGGVYVVTACYADQGPDVKQGHYSIMLRPTE